MEQGTAVSGWRPARREQLALVGAALLVVALYVALSAAGAGAGFPLDDAWIHQTYARNLAHTGRWEFVPGHVSAGSTAPLWTLLLAAGYLLGVPYGLWAYLLGGLCLAWLALAGARLWRALWPPFAAAGWAPGLALATSWPLVWAAGSGMETLLFTALGLQVAALYAGHARRKVAGPIRDSTPLWLGLLCGLLILARPDGVLLLALVGLGLLLMPAAASRPRTLVGFAAAAALPLLPYFAFNLWSSGHLWPNTLYAKQVEYAASLARPLPLRLLSLLYFSLGGPENGWRGLSAAHLLLLPGLVVAAGLALRADWQKRRLLLSLPLLWAAGHVALYAWRLPVTYQHGRYLLAALPVWLLFGLAGWRWLLARLPGGPAARRLASLASGLVFSAMLLIFLLLGGRQYAADVALINGEMVQVGRWLNENTGPDELIAAHDIGAIGYFAGRPLLDLAGLISPQVIPFLNDEPALAAYVRQSPAAYLVTAPGWTYPSLTGGGDVALLYTTGYPWTVAQGRNNMAVYRLPGR